MLKRILLLTQLMLLPSFAAWSDLHAQDKKPSQALRQLAEQQRKLSEELQREVEQLMERSSESGSSASAPAFAPDLDEADKMDEALIKFAAERAAGFRINEWKGVELYALGALYQLAEQFAPAGEAFRAYLKGDSGSRAAANARTGLIRALIQTEQLAEAEKLLVGAEWIITDNPAVLAARAGLYKDLAIALRDRGLSEKAAELAKKGYTLAELISDSRRIGMATQEAARRNQVTLAALAVASYERTGRKKEAGDLNKLVMDFDFNRQPELRAVYESELAAARLIGTPAPELDVSRWIEGKHGAPKSLAELRGKVVLLDFWAMWCGPCVAAFPRLRQFQSKYAQAGFEILGVTKLYGRSDTEESLAREQEFKSLQNYKARHQLAYPFAVGKMDDVANEERYGVAGIPTVILIDRRGVVRHVKRGIGEYRKLEKQIVKLIGEK
ncbi:MAG: TlpA family protein disulfide reductase [Blastocatellales bacterium]